MMKCILYGFTFVALSISVTAQDMLSVNATQTRYSVTVGNTVVLNCNVYGTATSVHWYFQYKLLNTTDSRFTNGNLQIPSLTISGIRSSDDGFYFCQARNSATETTVNTDTIILEVLTGTGGSVPHSVTINLPSDSITITQGQTVSVTCDSHGSQPITYIWYTDDASTPVENKASITISESNPGTYRYVCRATNIYGFAEKGITVHIQPLQTRPLTISITPPNVAVEENTEYTLTCQADGYPEPTYQWSKDGTVISNGATLYVPSALYTTNNGIHTCNATNKLGSIVQNANVDVHSAPSTINISHANVNVQQGNSFSLTCVANGNPTPTYKWYYKGNWIHTGSNLIVNNALYDNNHGSYTCNATNSEGYKQKSVEVNVQYIRSLVTQTSIQASVGNPVTLICDTEANPPGTTRSWRYNSGNVLGSTDRELHVDMDTANDAGVYTCTATNAIGQSVVIDFTVSIENVGPTSVIIIPASVTVIEKNGYTLSCYANGIPAPSYQWLFRNVVIFQQQNLTIERASHSNNHGIHTCKATNILGFAQATANVDVQYIPRSTNSQTTVQGSVNTPLTLSCNTTANPPARSWEWRYNGAILSYTGRDLEIDMDSISDAGSYTCKARNSVGQSGDINFTVIVGSPLGPSTITITPLNTVVQQGNSYTLTCNANGNPVPTYQWFRNGVELNPGKVLTVSSASNSIHHGTHICKATNDYGSIQSSANVNVQYIPESSVLQNSVTGIVGNPLNLTCSTTANPPAIAWEWKYNGNDLTHTGKILTVDMDTTNDIGTYTCRATNQVGTSNDITFTVIDGTPPATGATIVDTGLTAGEIAAIILGLLFGLLLLLALLIFCCCPQACAGCCGGCGRRNDKKVEPEGKPSKIITYYEQPDDYVINYRTLEIPRFHEVSDRQPSAEYEINKYTVLKPDYNNRLEATFIPTTDPETDNTYMSSNNSRQYIIPNEENKEERRRRRRRRRKKRSRNDNYSDDHLRDNEIVIEERIVNGDVRHSSIRTSDGDVHMRSSDYYLYT